MIRRIVTVFLAVTTYLAHAQEQPEKEKYVIKNLKINNSYSNFGTTFYGEDKVVYASPRKTSPIIRNVWKGNDQPFLDLFVGDIAEDGQLLNVKGFSENINKKYHEADVAFTKDKRTVYFSRNNYLNGVLTRDSTGVGLIQLYRAHIANNGEWTNIEPMPFNNDHYQTGHPTLSADERTLYFISDMPGGYGKTDVYKASISETGEIGMPVNMGPKINTPGREMFSSISGNDELYFSSDGREDGLGQLDIYVSKIIGNNISNPQNLGIPINSERDDFSFIINYDNRRGYFSSNRRGGKGDDDIYTFVQNVPLVFECNQMVVGTVIDKISGTVIPHAEVVLFDDKGEELQKITSDEHGNFHFDVDCNKPYKVVGTKKGFTTDNKEFFATAGDDINVPLLISSSSFVSDGGKCKVKINPIFFDYNKHDIRDDAAFELNKVVEAMNEYPDLIIEGGSHTDSRGSFKYNERLSSNRARSTVDYIIKNGIDPNRITSKGYGEYELTNGCADGVKCNEREHQYNRRTEFVIMNFEEISKIHPEICPIETVTVMQLKEKEKEAQQNQEQDVSPQVLEQRKKKYLDANFEKINNEIKIKLNPIYFDMNESYIKKEAARELDKVVEIMEKYPDLIVECASHTDARASDQYNEKLSQNRANSSVKYILAKGISSERIFAKGYGERLLTNECADGVKCTEEQHALNRRTEFIVLNPEVIK